MLTRYYNYDNIFYDRYYCYSYSLMTFISFFILLIACQTFPPFFFLSFSSFFVRVPASSSMD